MAGVKAQRKVCFCMRIKPTPADTSQDNVPTFVLVCAAAGVARNRPRAIPDIRLARMRRFIEFLPFPLVRRSRRRRDRRICLGMSRRRGGLAGEFGLSTALCERKMRCCKITIKGSKTQTKPETPRRVYACRFWAASLFSRYRKSGIYQWSSDWARWIRFWGRTRMIPPRGLSMSAIRKNEIEIVKGTMKKMATLTRCAP